MHSTESLISDEKVLSKFKLDCWILSFFCSFPTSFIANRRQKAVSLVSLLIRWGLIYTWCRHLHGLKSTASRMIIEVVKLLITVWSHFLPSFLTELLRRHQNIVLSLLGLPLAKHLIIDLAFTTYWWYLLNLHGPIRVLNGCYRPDCCCGDGVVLSLRSSQRHSDCLLLLVFVQK